MHNGSVIPVHCLLECDTMTLKQRAGKKRNATSLLGLSKAYGFKASTQSCFLTFLWLRSFKICCKLVSKTCSQAFITKRFIHLAVLKLFMRFLHYINYNVSISGKHSSLYHSSNQEVYLPMLLVTKKLYMLQKHEKCNFVRSFDKEMTKRS